MKYKTDTYIEIPHSQAIFRALALNVVKHDVRRITLSKPAAQTVLPSSSVKGLDTQFHIDTMSSTGYLVATLAA